MNDFNAHVSLPVGYAHYNYNPDFVPGSREFSSNHLSLGLRGDFTLAPVPEWGRFRVGAYGQLPHVNFPGSGNLALEGWGYGYGLRTGFLIHNPSLEVALEMGWRRNRASGQPEIPDVLSVGGYELHGLVHPDQALSAEVNVWKGLTATGRIAGSLIGSGKTLGYRNVGTVDVPTFQRGTTKGHETWRLELAAGWSFGARAEGLIDSRQRAAASAPSPEADEPSQKRWAYAKTAEELDAMFVALEGSDENKPGPRVIVKSFESAIESEFWDEVTHPKAKEALETFRVFYRCAANYEGAQRIADAFSKLEPQYQTAVVHLNPYAFLENDNYDETDIYDPKTYPEGFTPEVWHRIQMAYWEGQAYYAAKRRVGDWVEGLAQDPAFLAEMNGIAGQDWDEKKRRHNTPKRQLPKSVRKTMRGKKPEAQPKSVEIIFIPRDRIMRYYVVFEDGYQGVWRTANLERHLPFLGKEFSNALASPLYDVRDFKKRKFSVPITVDEKFQQDRLTYKAEYGAIKKYDRQPLSEQWIKKDFEKLAEDDRYKFFALLTRKINVKGEDATLAESYFQELKAKHPEAYQDYLKKRFAYYQAVGKRFDEGLFPNALTEDATFEMTDFERDLAPALQAVEDTRVPKGSNNFDVTFLFQYVRNSGQKYSSGATYWDDFPDRGSEVSNMPVFNAIYHHIHRVKITDIPDHDVFYGEELPFKYSVRDARLFGQGDDGKDRFGVPFNRWDKEVYRSHHDYDGDGLIYFTDGDRPRDECFNKAGPVDAEKPGCPD